jgi:hypothetical protein
MINHGRPSSEELLEKEIKLQSSCLLVGLIVTGHIIMFESIFHDLYRNNIDETCGKSGLPFFKK